MICASLIDFTQRFLRLNPSSFAWAENRLRRRPPPAATQPDIKTMNLSLQDADIHHAIRLISDVADLNFVIADGVSGTVTVELTEVPWTDALNAILMSKGLMAVPIGEIVFVQAIAP